MGYQMNTRVPWSRTLDELRENFRLWGVAVYNVWPKRLSDAGSDPRVRVEFQHHDGRTISLVMEDHREARDNLRVLYLTLQAMRLNELRGLGDLLSQAYLQLAAPETERDPYEVLGVRPDAEAETVEAVYRSLAKRRHPDHGGSEEAMAELNGAIERIRAERGDSQ